MKVTGKTAFGWALVALLVFAFLPFLVTLASGALSWACASASFRDSFEGLCQSLPGLYFVGFAWFPYTLALGAIGAACLFVLRFIVHKRRAG